MIFLTSLFFLQFRYLSFSVYASRREIVDRESRETQRLFLVYDTPSFEATRTDDGRGTESSEVIRWS